MSFKWGLLAKYSKTGIHYVSSLVLTDLSILTGKNLVKPKQVYYLLTDKCNARCIMCGHWKKGNTENKEDWISIARMKEILFTLAKWKVPKFGISGGEPLLFEERMFELLSTANSLGMYSHFVTNGWLLRKEVLSRYDKIGGGHISLSLDGIANTHDQMRGMSGLYSRCVKAIETFRSLRLKNVHMKINTVLGRGNLNEIGDLIKISRESSIPIFFQPFDAFNYESLLKLSQDEMAQKYPLWISSDENELLDKQIQSIKVFKRQFPHLVLNSENHLNLIPHYFKNSIPPGQKRKCIVAFENMTIQPNGDVKLCWIGKRGNLKEKGVKEIYYSEAYNEARKKALACRYPCMLGCFVRQNLWELVKIGVKNIRGAHLNP